MGGAGRRDARRLLRTGPCPPRQLGSGAGGSPSRSLPRHGSTAAGSGGAPPKRRRGFIADGPGDVTPCGPGGDAPGRRVEAWGTRLGVAVPHLGGAPAPADEVRPATPPGAPLVVRMAPCDPSRAPTTRRHRTRVIAASPSGPGAKRSCGARPPGVCSVGVCPLRGGGLTSASPT